MHQKPKQLSLSPPSRTAASASSQAGGESALEPLSTTKGRAGSRISKNQKHIPHPPSRTQVSSSRAHSACLDASHQSSRLSQATDVSCSWLELSDDNSRPSQVSSSRAHSASSDFQSVLAPFTNSKSRTKNKPKISPDCLPTPEGIYRTAMHNLCATRENRKTHG